MQIIFELTNTANLSKVLSLSAQVEPQDILSPRENLVIPNVNFRRFDNNIHEYIISLEKNYFISTRFSISLAN
jgi:hypothetical protein